MEKYDLVVIGAGSGGFAAARTAAALGKKVALVDRGPFGGLCILRGCMPSKTLIRSSELARLFQNSEDLGMKAASVHIDYPKIIARKNKIIAGFANDRFEEVKSNPNITLVDDSARFVTPHEVQAGNRTLRGEKFVIATGSKVLVPPFSGLAETGFLTSDEALEIDQLPRTLAGLGGGAIALELGQHFSRMGVAVTLIARSGHLLRREDSLVGETLARIFQEEGMTVYTGAEVERVSREEEGKKVRFRFGGRMEELLVDEILVATGRQADLDRLNLEVARVEHSEVGLVVNDEMETNVPGIFGAGDAVGIYKMAHVAVYQGEIAGHNAFSVKKRHADYRVVPEVIFTDPPFGRVGLSEGEAKANGIPVETAAYLFDDLGKAICTGQMVGFARILAHAETGEILGAQILGAESGSMIHEMATAVWFRATVHQFAQVPHFHPTLSEILTYPAEALAERIRIPVDGLKG